ncbi:hypothetical protein ACVWXM_006115 [Bradyrhizobium sp. GM7.3]
MPPTASRRRSRQPQVHRRAADRGGAVRSLHARRARHHRTARTGGACRQAELGAAAALASRRATDITCPKSFRASRCSEDAVRVRAFCDVTRPLLRRLGRGPAGRPVSICADARRTDAWRRRRRGGLVQGAGLCGRAARTAALASAAGCTREFGDAHRLCLWRAVSSALAAGIERGLPHAERVSSVRGRRPATGDDVHPRRRFRQRHRE